MSIIALPSSVRIKHIEWELDRPAQVNRSAYDGTRTVVANPWHGKWAARVTLATEQDEANVRAWRSFLAKLKGQINPFALPATEVAQHSVLTAVITSSGSAAGGATSISLASLSPVELVTNGTFTTNTSGWSVSGNVTLSQVGFRMRITSTGGQGAGYQAVTTAVGQEYTFGVDGFNGTELEATQVGSSLGGTEYYNANDFVGGSGVGRVVTFTATTTTTYIYCGINSAGVLTAGEYCEVDNISLQRTGGTITLQAGMLATVTLPSGNKQLLQIVDVAGSTITFEPPLREAISAGAIVETANPFALVALTDSAVRWSVDPYRLYNFSFDVEEAF